MTVDLINACFELLGAMFIWMNTVQLYKDKEIKGVFIPTILFFFLWGVWNIYFYWSLEQHLSWYAGMFLTAGNLVWLCQILYYKDKGKT